MNWEEQKKQYAIKRKEIYNKSKAGMSYTQLSREYNVSASRIGSIVKYERKNEAKITQE